MPIMMNNALQDSMQKIIKEVEYKEPVYLDPKSESEPFSPEVIEANNNFKNYLHENFG